MKRNKALLIPIIIFSFIGFVLLVILSIIKDWNIIEKMTSPTAFLIYLVIIVVVLFCIFTIWKEKRK